MKILWLTVMTEVIESAQKEKNIKTSGGWITATAKNLEGHEEVDNFIIVSINRDIKDEIKVTDGKKTVYHISANQIGIGRNKILEEKLSKIIREEEPDIIDIQGTEFSFGESLLKCDLECPVCITLQGFATKCAELFCKGIPLSELIFGRTKFDNLHLLGLFERKIMMSLIAAKQKRIIKNVDYSIGRTHFDKTEAEKINPKIKYFSCNRILRDDFYSMEWDIKRTNPHKLFGISSGMPYKGLHYAVKVIAKLKDKYPDVVLEIPGGFKIDASDSTLASYPKYIKKLIEKYDVKDNIVFLPSLNPAKIGEHMMSSRAFYQYSIIENSPNSLAEAQIMGVPCVASNVGGTSSYVEDEISGLLYGVDNVDECVEKISRIFEEDDLCLKLSENGRKAAYERHNVAQNTEKLVSIYKEIILK